MYFSLSVPILYELSHNLERYNMENNTTFKITYYSNKDKKHITRQGKWTDKCRYWTSKQGAKLMTYFDMDADNYRTAKGSWKVRL